jgi:hypothetical protein
VLAVWEPGRRYGRERGEADLAAGKGWYSDAGLFGPYIPLMPRWLDLVGTRTPLIGMPR